MAKILIAGDYSPRARVSDVLNNGRDKQLFSGIDNIINSVDYSIVDFETVVVEKNMMPISKFGPNLRCSSNAVSALKNAGFDCVTLANNHFRDYGDEGVMKSLELFKTEGLDYVGGGMNIQEAEAILYKEFEDVSLAIINVCENEFSIATSKQAGSAPLDTIKVVRQIKLARKGADNVLIIVHGGHEHYQLPSPRMKELYRFFIEEGADAVINHHQHCYSGYEVYKEKPIFYGLGNFLFDHPRQRNSTWNKGYMVVLNFSSSNVQFEIIPYIQCNEEPLVRPMNSHEKELFDNNINRLNSIIVDPENRLEEEMERYYKEKQRAVLGVFTPYMNEYVRAAASRHWLPYLLPKKKVLAMINYIACESQRDVTLGFFQYFVNNTQK